VPDSTGFGDYTETGQVSLLALMIGFTFAMAADANWITAFVRDSKSNPADCLKRLRLPLPQCASPICQRHR
jgi:acetoacetate decarboxylase